MAVRSADQRTNGSVERASTAAPVSVSHQACRQLCLSTVTCHPEKLLPTTERLPIMRSSARSAAAACCGVSGNAGQIESARWRKSHEWPNAERRLLRVEPTHHHRQAIQ